MNSSNEIKKEYEKLKNLPADADGMAKRRRGFAFERLLNKLFALDNMEPRTGFRPAGEQIDGSIYLDGCIYLLEAKWHAKPLPASTLYEFKGKVDGKLAGTIGIFISMSGYSEGAIDALILGKALNIILFDQRDMDAAIVRGSGIKSLLKFKLRKAAEEGTIYFPTEEKLVTAEKTSTVEIELLHYDKTTGGVIATQSVQPATADLLIVCEGESDRVVIATLAERILEAGESRRSIKILTAMGKIGIPRVANAMWKTYHSESKVLIVVDGDRDPAGTFSMLEKGLEFEEWISAIPNPSIETWLNLDQDTWLRQMRILDELGRAAKNVDIEALRAEDQEFAKFYNAILEA